MKRAILFFVLFLASLFCFKAIAQIQFSPGTTIVCPKEKVNAPRAMGLSQLNRAIANNAQATTPTATFIMNYSPEVAANQAMVDAFEFATNIWAHEIKSDVPIIVDVNLVDFSGNTLATAGPTFNVWNIPNTPIPNVSYPIALANAFNGRDLLVGESDITVNIDSSGTNFYFGTDGNTPPDQFDFVTIILHELGHGLGFLSEATVDSSGAGSFTGERPYIMDTFLTDGAGNDADLLPEPSIALGDFFKSGNAFVDATNTNNANSGNRVKVYAPSTFFQGTSMSHWDLLTVLGTSNALMGPSISNGTSNFDIGDFTRGAMFDIGWPEPIIQNSPPRLFINGNPIVFLEVGEAYTELGVNAVDDEDGSLNDQVIIGGDLVDTNTVGTYIVTYNVTDSGGLAAEEITRTVNVIEPNSRPFISTWQTTASNESITIPTAQFSEYDYSVDWGDGTIESGFTEDATHIYANPGTYTVSISGLFSRIYFNNSGDKEKIRSIEQWGDIVWTSMNHAFWGCSNLVENASDAPNLSIVTNLDRMFMACTSFNQDIGNWVVPNTVTTMISTFHGATLFNQPINNWDVSNVTNMNATFSDATSFNQDLNNWNVGNVQDFNTTFSGTTVFNGDITNWDVSSATAMNFMFQGSRVFNRDIGGWDVSNVLGMAEMFSNARAFNQDIGNWNVGKVRSMGNMFAFAQAFNQDIGNWDVGNVTYMRGMFTGATIFNQDIGGWNVSKVDNIGFMFSGTDEFNQDLSSWNVANVEWFNGTFALTKAFDQDISSWNTGSARSFERMFFQSQAFDQDLGNWDISNVENMSEMFSGAALGIQNYDTTLQGWSTLDAQEFQIPQNINFDGGNSQFCTGELPRQDLIDNFGWTITDAGKANNCVDFTNAFITTWEVPVTLSIFIPTDNSLTYNYSIDWGDGTIETGLTGNANHNYPAEGTYTVSIIGTFPKFHTNTTIFNPNRFYLRTIEQWGNIEWVSFERSFIGCEFLDVTATDTPNLSQVTNLEAMFQLCRNLEGNVAFNNWDVSNITSMYRMFSDAELFNQDISAWNVENVISMAEMFSGASAFNQPIGNWTTSQLRNVQLMFRNATTFNQSIGTWNTSQFTSTAGMFFGATVFNQPLNDWDVAQVLTMDNMFQNASSFNQPLNDWDVGQVFNMSNMFDGASTFNQNLGSWNVGSLRSDFELDPFGLPDGPDIASASEMFENAGLSVENYDALLIGWGTLDTGAGETQVPNGITLDAGASQFCDSETQRQDLIDNFNWTIADGGLDCPINNAFVTTWKTDNANFPGGGISNSPNNTISIPTNNDYVYDYDIDWGDGTSDTNVTDDIQHTYTQPGTYTVSITGTFPSIYFDTNEFGEQKILDNGKILTVENWGAIVWMTMERAFLGCQNLDVVATDIPNLTNVTNFSNMFSDCQIMAGNSTFQNWDVSGATTLVAMFRDTQFNQPIGGWNVENVTDMSSLFSRTPFNQDLSVWNVQGVTGMSNMFFSSSFNQDINNWSVDNVVNMSGMFANSDFNQPIGSWNVANVTSMSSMFEGSLFNQDLSAWNVANVDDMRQMFANTPFDQDISSWNVANVEEMSRLFSNGVFDGDISSWNVSNVRFAEAMFENNQVFNQDISGWDVSQLVIARQMFKDAIAFDQNLGSWDVSNLSTFDEMFNGITLSTENYDGILTGWAALPSLQSNRTFDGGNSTFCTSAQDRQNLIENLGWTITDGGRSVDCPIDDELPIITCPDQISQSAGANCLANVVLVDPTAIDNVSTVFNFVGIRNDGLALGEPFMVGTTTITWTATDEAGNVSEPCEQQIVISARVQDCWQPIENGTIGKSPFTNGDAVAVDRNGDVVILSVELDNQTAGLQRFSSGTWVQLGPNLPNFVNTGQLSSIVFDTSNSPIVLYKKSDATGVGIVKLVANVWQDVGAIAGLGDTFEGFSSLEIDGANNLYFAYLDGNYDVKAASFNGTSWNALGGIIADADQTSSVQLTLDTNNVPIVVANPNFSRLSAYQFDGGTWQVLGQEDFTNATFDPLFDIVVDQNNVPILVFGGISGDDFTALSFDGSNWSNLGNSIAGFAIDRGKKFLAIDNSNRPILLGNKGGNSPFATLIFDGGQWNTLGADSFGVQGGFSSLAKSDDNTFYISYNVSNLNEFNGQYLLTINIPPSDIQPPTITCAPNIVEFAPEGELTVPVGISELPTVSDNVSAPENITITGERSDGGPIPEDDNFELFPIGDVIITWTATDEAGNVSETCEQLVSIAVREANGNLDGNGALSIADSDSDSDDSYSLTVLNGDLIISSSAGLQIFGDGVVQVDARTVQIPLANLTNGLTIDGGNGNNTVDIDTTLQLLGPDNGLNLININAQVMGTGNLQLNALNVDNGVFDTNGLITEVSSSASFTNGSTLIGVGNISGTVNVDATSTIAPGTSPGIINTGNLILQSGATYDAEVFGTTPGTEHDQTIVTGTVDINGATLNLIGGYANSVGDEIILIDNDGTDAVTGTFAGLAEGATVTFGSFNGTISYVGGDGNDVSLVGGQGLVQGAFVTTWKTDNEGVSADNQITIPTDAAFTYNYTVDWGDGSSNTGVSGNITHTYASAGTYDVSITGDFPAIRFNDQTNPADTDSEKLLSVKQWGTIAWQSFAEAFRGCSNMDITAIDLPDLSLVTQMFNAFRQCTNLVGNSSFSNWDTSTVTNMGGMFGRTNNFNQPIGNWDVSSVTDMRFMFFFATSFNQPLDTWNVSSLQNMDGMFSGGSIFDQPLGNWDISSLVTAQGMFDVLSTANYDDLLNGWSTLDEASGETQIPSNVIFGAGNSQSSVAGQTARQNLVDNFSWSITDIQNISPTQGTFNPPNGSNLVPVDQTFTVVFNELVRFSDTPESIFIFDLSPEFGFGTVQELNLTNGNFSLADDGSVSTLTINPSEDLPPSKLLSISIPPGLIEDFGANQWEGTQGNGDGFLWHFTTALGDASCTSGNVDLEITFDDFASETSWELRDQNSTIVDSAAYTAAESNTTINDTFSGLADGTYTFTMFDTFGDGICCGVGNGSFVVSKNGIELFRGGKFLTEQSFQFCIDATIDAELPVITCPSDVSQDAGTSCSTVVTLVDPTATDNVSTNFVFEGVRSDGLPLTDPFFVGNTTITWTAQDEAGNVSESCQQIITITGGGDCWTLVGNEIFGTADSGTGAGVSINGDGDIVAYVSPNVNGFGNLGTVTVLQRDGNSWSTLGNTVNGGQNTRGSSGIDLNDSGNRMAVSQIEGAVNVYELVNGNWQQLGVTIPAVGQTFIQKLDFDGSGNRLAVGYSRANDRGQVVVYELQSGNWVQLGSILEGIGLGDLFGRDVTLNADGTRVAVGAYQVDTEGFGRPREDGYVQIFEFVNGDWAQLGDTIFSNEDPTDDFFGVGVSLNDVGNRLVVGANAGDYAKVFEFQNGSWSQLGQTLFAISEVDQPGYQVDINGAGDIVLIGDFWQPAQIFQWNGTTWQLLGQPIYNEVGQDVSINKTGNVIILGTPEPNGTGKVAIYEYTGDLDSEAPVITCPENLEVVIGENVNTATITLEDPTATDNVSTAFTFNGVRSDGLPLTDPYPIGATTITWTATDQAGNVSTPCNQTISVFEAESEAEVVDGDLSVKDCTNDTDDTYDIAIEDGFLILSNNAPIIVSGDGVEQRDANTVAIPLDGLTTVTINGGNGTDTLTLPAGLDLDALGVDLITDNIDVVLSGNGALNLANLSINNGNFATNPDVTVNISVEANFFADATLSGNGAINGVVNMNVDSNLFPGASPGIVNTGNLTLDNNNNEFEVNGTTPGTEHDQVVVTGTVTIVAGTTLDLLGGYVNGDGDEIVLIANDGTDAISGTFDGLAEGSSVNFGDFSGAISYLGGDGNDLVLIGEVEAPDTDAPVLICSEDRIWVNFPENCSAPPVPPVFPEVIDNVTLPEDIVFELRRNGTLIDLENIFNEIGDHPVGTTTYTWVAIDEAGNRSETCTSLTIVNDIEPPVSACQDITVQLDENGLSTITAADIDNGSTDNCGISSLSVSPSSFTEADLGDNTVTLTVTDVNGQVSTCTATVTVEANIPEECPDFLPNEDPSIVIAEGGGIFLGLDEVFGTNETTNGSPCALVLVNNDPSQPFAHHRISLPLANYGINSGDELFISLDALNNGGIARVEVNQDNRPNTALAFNTYSGPGWETFSTTITVPAGISSIDLWLYSNYLSSAPGTTYYDNLIITNLSSGGGNIDPVANAGPDQTVTDGDGNGSEAVILNGSASVDPDGSIVSYSWSDSSGEVATGATPTVTLPLGATTLTLTVTDNDGVSDSDVVVINVVEQPLACPDSLSNEDPSIVLPVGNGFLGIDAAVGTSEVTNGSPCALALVNTDGGQPFANYRIPIDLASYDISPGDELFISLDGNSITGTARIEVLRNNTPNQAALAHTYTGGWSTFSQTIIVPSGITSLDIWLYSNYLNFVGGGTAYYDNLIVTNLSVGGGNIDPIANAGPDQTVIDGDSSGTEDVTLDGSGSFDLDGIIVDYSWSNGSTGVSPTATFPVGTTTVTLTVTDDGGATASDTVDITVVDPGAPCPDSLPNEEPSIPLTAEGGFLGIDDISGTSTVTNGSPCALALTNNDVGQPFANYRIPIVLADHGINPGDQLLISLDGNSSQGTARIEVNRNNSPNTALAFNTYVGGWSTFSQVVTVPSGTTSLNIWLYSNYLDSGSGGTAFYDNLLVRNLGPAAVPARFNLNGLNVWPNPATESVSMGFDEPTEVVEFQVFDLLGRLVRTVKVDKNEGEHQMQVYDLPVGTYFIKTTDSRGQQFQEQMVIER